MDNGWRTSEMGLAKAVQAVRHHIVRSVKIVAGFLVVGIIYLLVAEFRYTAETTMIMDGSYSGSRSPATLLLELDTRALLLESPSIAARVVVSEKLHLSDEFAPSPSRLPWIYDNQQEIDEHAALAQVIETATKAGQAIDFGSLSNGAAMHKVISKLQRNLAIQREGTTRLISIKYTSASPEQAAQLSSAFADAYLAFQTDPSWANKGCATPGVAPADCQKSEVVTAEPLQVLSYALVPFEQSWPKPLAVLTIFFVVGGMFAAALIIRDEWYMFL